MPGDKLLNTVSPHPPSSLEEVQLEGERSLLAAFVCLQSHPRALRSGASLLMWLPGPSETHLPCNVVVAPRPGTLPSPPEEEGRGSPKTGPVGEGVGKERRLEEMKRVTRVSPWPRPQPPGPGTAISGPGHPQESCFMWEEGWEAEM